MHLVVCVCVGVQIVKTIAINAIANTSTVNFCSFLKINNIIYVEMLDEANVYIVNECYSLALGWFCASNALFSLDHFPSTKVKETNFCGYI